MIDYNQGVSLQTIDEIPLEELRSWRNDYRIFKWTRQNDLISKFRQNEWREKLISDRTIQMYSIFDKKKNGLGACGLTGIDSVNRRAEFSLYIAPRFHKKGFGRAALKTLISHGFNSLGLNSIWGETFVENPARHLFYQLGFSFEGLRREFYFRDGKFIDAEILSLLHNEWRRLNTFNDCRQLCFT